MLASSVARTSSRERADLARLRRVVAEVALAVAHDADLGRDVEADLPAGADDELGRAAADVDHEQRLVVAGSRVAVAPRKVRRASSSPVSVRAAKAERVLDRRRRTSAPLAASRTAEVITAVALLALVLLDRARNSSSTAKTRSCGAVAEPAAGVDALAEPGETIDARARSGRSVDVGDQQPGRVRADVDDGDAHQAGCGSGSPASAASRLSTAMLGHARARSCVAEPTCGQRRAGSARRAAGRRRGAARGR